MNGTSALQRTNQEASSSVLQNAAGAHTSAAGPQWQMDDSTSGAATNQMGGQLSLSNQSSRALHQLLPSLKDHHSHQHQQQLYATNQPKAHLQPQVQVVQTAAASNEPFEVLGGKHTRSSPAATAVQACSSLGPLEFAVESCGSVPAKDAHWISVDCVAVADGMPVVVGDATASTRLLHGGDYAQAMCRNAVMAMQDMSRHGGQLPCVREVLVEAHRPVSTAAVSALSIHLCLAAIIYLSSSNRTLSC